MNAWLRILSLPKTAVLILVFQLLINAGSFMVIPYLAVYVVKDLGMAVAFAGVVLTVKSACQRGLILYGGYLVDRYGEYGAIVSGNLLRIVSYIGLALWTGQSGLLISAALLGGSSALFIPASKSALAKAVGPEQRHFVFASRNVFNNLGVATGGILGSYLIRLSPEWIFLSAALIQSAVLAYYVIAMRAQRKTEGPAHSQNTTIKAAPYAFFTAARSVIGTRGFIAISLINIVFYAIYIQLELTLPLHADHFFGLSSSGAIFTINAIVIIALQLPLAQWLGRRCSQSQMLCFGFAVVGLSFVGFGALPGFPAFGVMVAVYTIGEMIIDPTIDTAANASVPSRYAGTVFGLLGITALIGSLLGGTVGGRFFARMADQQSYWFWYAALSFFVLPPLLVGIARQRRGRATGAGVEHGSP